MKLVKFVHPGNGNAFYINPDAVISIVNWDPEGTKIYCLDSLTDADGYIVAENVDEVAMRLQGTEPKKDGRYVLEGNKWKYIISGESAAIDSAKKGK